MVYIIYPSLSLLTVTFALTVSIPEGSGLLANSTQVSKSRRQSRGLSRGKSVVVIPTGEARILPKIYLTAGVATSSKIKGGGGNNMGGGGGWGSGQGGGGWMNGNGGGGGWMGGQGGQGGWGNNGWMMGNWGGNGGWGPPPGWGGGGGGSGWGGGGGWKEQCEDKKAQKAKSKAKKKKAKAKKKAMKKGGGGWGPPNNGWGGGGQSSGWGSNDDDDRLELEDTSSEEQWPNSFPRTSRGDDDEPTQKYDMLETFPLFLNTGEQSQSLTSTDGHSRTQSPGDQDQFLTVSHTPNSVGASDRFISQTVHLKLVCPNGDGQKNAAMCYYTL